MVIASSFFTSMAQITIVHAFLLALIVAVFSAVASSQELAPPASPHAGSAFSLRASAAMVGASLLLSVSALLRHCVLPMSTSNLLTLVALKELLGPDPKSCPEEENVEANAAIILEYNLN